MKLYYSNLLGQRSFDLFQYETLFFVSRFRSSRMRPLAFSSMRLYYPPTAASYIFVLFSPITFGGLLPILISVHFGATNGQATSWFIGYAMAWFSIWTKLGEGRKLKLWCITQ